MTNERLKHEVDPGGAVPEEVAPLKPSYLSEEERRFKEELERLPDERQLEA